ncbi:hypothetical protein [Kitasatospora sp. NPDC093558]|uniref:hypothetical protein n=1 Tax=Kitasatospora sp. NPDC093558 TaxID=3155201 RepID=UPI00342AF136
MRISRIEQVSVHPGHARCGFRPLADGDLTPGLREIRRREAEHGLDRRPRLCMRRDLPEPACD